MLFIAISMLTDPDTTLLDQFQKASEASERSGVKIESITLPVGVYKGQPSPVNCQNSNKYALFLYRRGIRLC